MGFGACRGIGTPLAALFRGDGIDEERRRADEPLVQSGSRLDGHQCIHQGGSDTAAEWGQHCRQHTMRVGRVGVDLGETTGVQDRKIGAHPGAHLRV